MHKLFRTTVVVATALGSVGLLGVGTAYAQAGKGNEVWDLKLGTLCRSFDMNVDVLGELGLVSGAQLTPMGSSMGCKTLKSRR